MEFYTTALQDKSYFSANAPCSFFFYSKQMSKTIIDHLAKSKLSKPRAGESLIIYLVKPLLGMPTSYIRVPGSNPSYPLLLIQLLVNGSWEAAADGPTAWVPPTHVRDQEGNQAPGFNLAQPGLLWPFGG